MKKNKKGFTLIELLAVIVILGIIITIVVSNVVKYINQARTGSYKDAYSVIMKGIQTQLMANEMKDSATIELCDDEDADSSKYCSIKDDYKGMYDSKNISLAVKSDRANGYYIIIKPNQSGSFKGVTLGPDDTPKGALLENNDDTKDTGNILTSNISSSGEISAPSSAVSTGGKKVTTKKSS